MVNRAAKVPEYVRVKRDIEAMIGRGVLPSGGLVPGERGLAKTLKVNVGTVRRAVTELAGEGKLIRLPRIGTVVASPASLPNNQPFWTAIVPSTAYFFGPLVNMIEEEARARGTAIVLNCVGEDFSLEHELVDRAIAGGTRGILLAPAIRACQVRTPETLAYLEDLSIPIVIIDHWGLELPPTGLDCVLSDNFGGSYEAATHMIRHGYTRIAAFRPYISEIAPEFLQREKGYEAALADHDLPVPPLPPLHARDIDHNRETFKKIIKEHLEYGVEAILVGDDSTAFKFMNLLHEMGLKVPDQMAVIGYDNEPFGAYTYPTLSSVEVPKKEMARRAVKLLQERMESGSRNNFRTLVLRPQVVARQSCGKNCPLAGVTEHHHEAAAVMAK